MIIYISKIMTLGQFYYTECGLGKDNNVTFVAIKIHYENVFLWKPQNVAFGPL